MQEPAAPGYFQYGIPSQFTRGCLLLVDDRAVRFIGNGDGQLFVSSGAESGRNEIANPTIKFHPSE